MALFWPRRRSARLPRLAPGAAPGTLRTDPTAPRPTMHVMAYGPDDLVEHEIEEVAALDGLTGRFPVLWVDVHGIGSAEIVQALGERFGLHALALEDVQNTHQRPKIEAYPNVLYLVARMFELTPANALVTEQLSLFLGAGFVLTFQERPGDCFEPVRKRIRQNGPRLRKGKADYLAYALIDALVDNAFPVLERYGERLDDLEEETLSQPDTDTLRRIHETRRDLVHLRRALWPLRDALGQTIRDDEGRFAKTTLLFLRDCLDHLLRAIDVVETYRETASSLMDIYLSSLSHRMNEVMKVLTIIATIFIPLSFIAGLYGMNFDPEASGWNMPELRWRFGYPAALAAMAAVAGGLLFYFYRRGWLSSDDPLPPPKQAEGGAEPGTSGGSRDVVG